MEENLVIVESPAKARTIEKFLGPDFLVKSSFGHVRDLSKKNLGIDLHNNYQPEYVIADDKKKVVRDLKTLSGKANTVWLASDEDREGEAIAWHLCEVLDLESQKTRRIVFHEITSQAIEHAVRNPRDIDRNLVNSQQARRVLDRLVGFELSPVLWKKIKPALSAGRVQSVAVRLLVEREREITDFTPASSYKVTAVFLFRDKEGNVHKLPAELSQRFRTKPEAAGFLESCSSATFRVSDVGKKPATKSPSPPFTTSTLQQEASRRLGFSVSRTMSIAQRLYESGKITYMRTDSVHLSGTAIASCSKVIDRDFGGDYLRTRQYRTRTKGAQEAHEAIRPTYMENKTISGSGPEQKLYDLIWKRTLASQMSNARLEKTMVYITGSGLDKTFISRGEVLKFDGFLRVYTESADDESEEKPGGLLPPVVKGDPLQAGSIRATEKYSQSPPRYTEASLVKKLEELGIGRPSTYAPIISTIQQRGYVVKESRPGRERQYTRLELRDGRVAESRETERYGTEKNKLFPSDVGMIVNDFLVENFGEILDYNFTARVEKEFDEIAAGKTDWTRMIDRFYHPFHQKVEKATGEKNKTTGERLLGTDPETGKPVTARIGRYGPMVQLGKSTDQEKPRFASLLKGQSIHTITLDEALQLFKLPRSLGKLEGSEVQAGIGRFGPYIRHKSKFYSLNPSRDNVFTIKIDRAQEVIREKQEQEKNRIIKTFDEDPELKILHGRWGPYIKQGRKNFKIPGKADAASLSYEDCRKIIGESGKQKKK